MHFESEGEGCVEEGDGREGMYAASFLGFWHKRVIPINSAWLREAFG